MLLNDSLNFWKLLMFRSGENSEGNCSRYENIAAHPPAPSSEVRGGENNVNE